MALASNLKNMALSLTLVCLVCSAVLGAAYAITKDSIDAAAVEKLNKSLLSVMPQFSSVDRTEAGDVRGYIGRDAAGAPVGYAFETETVGFGGPLRLIVGITPDGQIYNTTVLSHNETPGLGAKCTSDAKFMGQWKGMDLSSCNLAVRQDGGDIDAITASTITSRAYTRAVAQAVEAFNQLKEEQSNE